MGHQYKISDLSPVCFWDVDKSKLSWEKDSEFIVERILEVGRLSDWRIICGQFGLERIAEICKGLRTMSSVDLNFISTITGTDIRDYRCYTTAQSFPTPWNS